jgi:pyruvyl transferase EpsO
MATSAHVETDRLHSAIVARLAGRPVTLVDNSYGKLSAYYDAWWTNDPEVTLR